MRVLVCLLLLMAASPALAKTRHAAGWVGVGHANYARSDYGRGGPVQHYYAANAFVPVVIPGMPTYSYGNGAHVTYGTVVELAPVLTSTPAIVPQGPALEAPMSPGPRVYQHLSGVRVWYGGGY